jgi:hypothetical protein
MANDENLYLSATNEFESDDRDPALWAKCMSLCEGDEQRAKYKYIKERVTSIEKHNKKRSSKALSNNRKDKGFIVNLSSGNYSLVQTYWLYGVLVELVIGISFYFITSKAGILFYFFGYSIYKPAVLLGTWRSANKYSGFNGWVILAKIATLLGWLSLLFAWVILIFNR